MKNVQSARMRVAALQMPLVWGDKAGALRRLEEAARDVDLLLLPEAAFTGYVSPSGDFSLAGFSEPLDGPTMTAVADLARRRGLAIAAPLIERAGERCYNAMVLFDDQGHRIGHWRKRHPWIPETWASPGDLGTPLVEWKGVRVTAAICFDLHFLESDAAAELESADVLLFPSCWVEEGPDTRVPKLQALARRFEIAVVNANWGRGVPNVAGQGGSVILDSDGKSLNQARGPDVQLVWGDFPHYQAGRNSCWLTLL